MNLFRSAAKAGVAMKVLDVVRREAAKPQNQAKARQLISRVTSRGTGSRSGRRATGGRWSSGRR